MNLRIIGRLYLTPHRTIVLHLYDRIASGMRDHDLAYRASQGAGQLPLVGPVRQGHPSEGGRTRW